MTDEPGTDSRNPSLEKLPRDPRHQPPIPKAELKKVERPEKVSQTALSHFDRCPRSAFLYWKHKGGAQTAPMVRGEIFHRFVEEAVEMLVDDPDSDGRMPPEVGKANVMGLIEDSPSPVPEYEQNVLRAMAWNWCEHTVIDIDAVVGLEQMIELDLGHGLPPIRGKLDFAEIGSFGALVRDYKTSIALPSHDEIQAGAKSFQGRFYALLLLFGIPEGESFPLGKGLDEVRVDLVYPRYVNPETDELTSRSVTWTRDQLVDFRHSLESHLAKIDSGFVTGDFPAQAGSHCAECPARGECPLPETAHEIGQITTVEEASEALELHFTRDAVQRKLMKTISAFHEDYAEPIFMGDYAYDRRLEERRTVDWAAVMDNGGAVLPQHIKIVQSTPFKKRKMTAEQREQHNDD